MIVWFFLCVFLASICAVASAFMMRYSLNTKGTVGGYLSFYFLISCLFSFFLNSLFTLKIPFSVTGSVLGALTGIFVILLMFSMGNALKTGPSGLTVAFLNAGSIAPPLLMAMIFKSPFGFSLTIGNIAGLLFVLIGLFWAAFGKKEKGGSSRWILYALLTFAIQAIILSIYQWQNLLVAEGLPSHPFLPFHCLPNEMLWFTPSMFFFAWVLQIGLFFIKERRPLIKAEYLGGAGGGAANALATFFLLSAVKAATPDEKAMLFPLFAVLVILFSNLYSRIFYQEKVNWAANGCCALGILVGSTL